MVRLLKGDLIGIVACSNHFSTKLEQLVQVLKDLGLIAHLAPYYNDPKEQNFSMEQAHTKAHALLDFYLDPKIKMICDLSGGDSANQILPYLDFEIIKNNPKPFVGYSDLTVILNAILSKTGITNILYQISHLVDPIFGLEQQQYFKQFFMGTLEQNPPLAYKNLQGSSCQGVVVGGNARCLLKLAGTEYWPKIKDHILFLEANSGLESQLVTYFSQLQQLKAFSQISGLVLGTFTQLNQAHKSAYELLKHFVDPSLPIYETEQIGHAPNARALLIGGYYKFGV